MSPLLGTTNLYKALKDEGFDLPEECVDVRLEFPVDGAIQLVYRCNVTDETLEKIGEALLVMAREGRTL